MDDLFRAEYAQRFDTVIRQLLAQLQGRYAALMQRTKEIAGMQPAQGIKLFVSEIPGAVQLHGYFYDSLQSEEWLPWLARAGLLAEPLPDPIVGNVLRLWTWPVGRYLIRMAASTNTTTRKVVGDAIRALKSSRHPDVHRFGMEVIDALPPTESAELIDVICHWLTPGGPPPYVAAPHNIVAKLAAAGLIEPGLRLFRSLFQIFDREGQVAVLFDVTMYEHYVDEAVRRFAKFGPLVALPVLCELLREASQIDGRLKELNEEDHIYYSVDSLTAEHPSGQDVHGVLILSIVRLAKAAVQENQKSINLVQSILQRHRARIFRRIQLHVLALAPGEAPELAESYLTDAKFIDAHWCRDEYAELAKAWFPSLKPSAQRIILDTVDTIPGDFFDRWKELYTEQQGTLPTKEDEREYWATTIRDIVWGWKDALPEKRRKELDATVHEFGDPDTWRNRYVADTSPLSSTSMQTQPLDATIEYLHGWRPETGLQTHTIGALSNELRESAAADPSLFSANAHKFGHLRPIFIRRILEGIRRPATNGSKIHWGPIQILVRTAVERSRTPLNRRDIIPGDDSDWSLVLGVIADILAARLRGAMQTREFDDADVLQPLIIEVHTEIIRLPRPGLDRFDLKHPYFSSVQTTYGSSIELCVLLLQYLSNASVNYLGEVPRDVIAKHDELRQIFEEALSDRTIHGLIARAVFGRYLRLLCFLGEEWVRQQFSILFPQGDRQLKDATWIAHLQSDSGPAGPLLNEMAPLYAEHLAQLDHQTSTKSEVNNNRFADYLMMSYLWEALPEGLLEQFWLLAPLPVRRHAMWFMGRQLAGSNEANKARARLYWERRLKIAMEASDPTPYRKELGTIGQWFHSKIDDAWLLDQLQTMLSAGFSPNDGLGVVDKLAEHISDKLDQVIEITRVLVRQPEMDSWILASQTDALRRILVEATRSASANIRDAAKEIVSFLSSRGNTNFLDLA